MSTTPYNAVWIASAPRTGSMWAYYVTRQVLIAGGKRVMSPPSSIPSRQWPNFARKVIDKDDAGVVCCIKFHGLLRLDIPKTRFIVTYRDVRDATLSVMRFMHVDFEEGLRRAKAIMAVTDHYLQAPDDIALKLRYVDIVRSPVAIISQIAMFLDIPLATDQASMLAASVTRERVAALVEEHTRAMQALPATERGPTSRGVIRNPDGTSRFIEPKTGFQTGHITSTRDGVWREALLPEQQARLHALTADWLRRYGFAI